MDPPVDLSNFVNELKEDCATLKDSPGKILFEILITPFLLELR
jgi:hypothetical protein